MHSFSRDKLRRDVRAAVHRSCWRKLDGADDGDARASLSSEVDGLLAVVGDNAPGEEVIHVWIAEDESEFDRGLLIGELVARRLGGSVSRSSAESSARRSVAPELAAPPMRERRTSAPAIADLLDDMLEQQRRVRVVK